ncbi:MAG: autoinducer binding domain-containing protein [Rudaea sp.]
MTSWREDYLARLTQPGKDAQQVFDELALMSRDIGFEYCSLGIRVPSYGDVPLESWSTNYPGSWQERYLGHNYLTIDPVIEAAVHSPLPVVWNDRLFQQRRPFWEEARAHGVCHGWTLAMHGIAGEMGLLSLARSDVPVSTEELAEEEARLIWLAHTANGVIGTIVANANAPGPVHELTRREREVLRWTAAGKTSGEIGKILGVSTRTVNFHVNSALAKLNATNKTQAVVKAFLFNMLD